MRRGYSILELSVVIAVLAVLLTFSAIKIKNSSSDAKIEKTQEIVLKIRKASFYFYDDTGGFPSLIAELWKNENASGNPVPGWDGPYLSPPNGDLSATAITHVPAGTEAVVECSSGNYYRIVFKEFPESLCSLWDKRSDDGDSSAGKVRYSSGNCYYYVSFSDTICK